MPSVEKILELMRRNPKGVRYDELAKVCDHYFGPPRNNAASHRFYSTPWPGEPLVNIQNHNGQAKPYQVRQVLLAVDKLTDKEAR